MNKAGERLWNGLVKENPTLVLMLGMCPTLAVTTSAVNGFGMGATTLVVLALSNLIISLLRKVIPKRVRIPAFIVIIASFVTIVQLLMQAYLYSLNKALGVYIPLIVVNCIILGRAESYAYSNPPIPALFDGIGMGLGFTVALTCIGAVRELLGAGQLFGFSVMPDSYEPALIFVLAPGAFFVLAALTALQNFVKEKRKRAGKPYEKIGSGCTEDCMNCSDTGCTRRFYDLEAEDAAGLQKENEPPEEPIQENEALEEPIQENETLEELVQENETPEEPIQENEALEEPNQAEAAVDMVSEEQAGKEAQQPDWMLHSDETSLSGYIPDDREPAPSHQIPQSNIAVQNNGGRVPQNNKAVQNNGGKVPQNNKAVQNNGSRVPQNNKAAQNNSGRVPQSNKAAQNNSSKAVQYEKASQGRKPLHHRKVPPQGKK